MIDWPHVPTVRKKLYLITRAGQPDVALGIHFTTREAAESSLSGLENSELWEVTELDLS